MDKNIKIKIDENRCPADHPCPSIRVCPTKAISQEKKFFGLPKIDQDKCIGCKKCVDFCPMEAIEIEES